MTRNGTKRSVLTEASRALLLRDAIEMQVQLRTHMEGLKPTCNDFYQLRRVEQVLRSFQRVLSSD